jgi:hypothetical protein
LPLQLLEAVAIEDDKSHSLFFVSGKEELRGGKLLWRQHDG